MALRKRVWLRRALAAAPLLAVLLVAAGLHAIKQELRAGARSRALAHVRGVEKAFREEGYQWPPSGAVPARFIQHIPAGMDALQTATRKSLFFRMLLPVVLSEDQRIRDQRKTLEGLFAQGRLKGAVLARAAAIAARYDVSGDLNDPAVRQRLLLRVDVVPPGLVLAQAANESAWGTSRFAREGNNLFGQWTWQPAIGLVPRRRAPGATHYVRAFPDIRASVRAYLHNINVSDAYRPLRVIRAALRRQHRPLDPNLLAAGLVRYSQRGQAYVNDVRTMIRANGLDQLGALELSG